MSVPPGTEMFQFPGFASKPYVFRPRYPRKGGFPHSDIRGSTIARISPRLFAACHVLHRLLAPRHPPNALITLNIASPPPARRTKPPCDRTVAQYQSLSSHTANRSCPSAAYATFQSIFTCQRTFAGTNPSRDPTPCGGLGSAYHAARPCQAIPRQAAGHLAPPIAQSHMMLSHHHPQPIP